MNPLNPVATSLPNHEPPNGDFVAYLERIEAESLARQLPAAASTSAESRLVSPPATPATPAPAAGKRPAATSPVNLAAPLSADQARELLQRLGAGEFSLDQIAPVLAIGAGLLVIVGTAISGRGPLGIFIGIGLVVWGAKRLEALKKGQTRS